eukprot:COSAG04_NODE_1057_length_8525_cov_2.545336_5_plen_81_part_00
MSIGVTAPIANNEFHTTSTVYTGAAAKAAQGRASHIALRANHERERRRLQERQQAETAVAQARAPTRLHDAATRHGGLFS